MIYLSETNLQENSNRFFNLEQDESFVKVSWVVTQVVLNFFPKADIFLKNKERIYSGEILKLFCSKKTESLGWRPKMNSEQAINLVIDKIIKDHNHE